MTIINATANFAVYLKKFYATNVLEFEKSLSARIYCAKSTASRCQRIFFNLKVQFVEIDLAIALAVL